MNALEQVGDAIRRQRVERGWSRDRLAQAAGYSRETIRRIEQGAPGVGWASVAEVLQALGANLDVHGLAPQDT